MGYREYDKEFFDYLEHLNLSYIDNREKNGCLWISANEDIKSTIKSIHKLFGVTFRFKNEVKCLDGNPGWWMKERIMKCDVPSEQPLKKQVNKESYISLSDDKVQSVDSKNIDTENNSKMSEEYSSLDKLKDIKGINYYNLVYDEMFLFLYLFHCFKDMFESFYDSECVRVLEVLPKISERYDLNHEITTTQQLKLIIEEIEFFYSLKNITVKYFSEYFLIKYKYLSIDVLRSKYENIILKYKRNEFKDENYFEMYNLEKIDCFEKDVASCDFSMRTINRLKSSGINNIFDLLCMSVEELSAIKYFGSQCFDDIEKCINHLKEQLLIQKAKIKADETVEMYIKEKNGDFSNIDNEDNPFIEQYKHAYEILDIGLIQACKDNPSYIWMIINSFEEFNSNSRTYDIRLNTIKSLMEDLTEKKKNNRYIYYAQAYNFNDDSLIDFCYSKKSDLLEDFDRSLDHYKEEQYVTLQRFLRWCAFDVKEEIKSFLDEFVNGRYSEIIAYRAEKMTLEQTGEKLHVTRERVRQIEAKILRAFDHALKTKKFFHKIRAELNGKSIITYDDICSFSSGMDDVLWYLLKNNKTPYYKYDSESNVIIANSGISDEEIRKFIDSLPFSFTDDYVYKEYEDKFSEDHIELFKKLLECDYAFYGGYYFKKRFNSDEIFNGIVDAFFPEGIKIYDPYDLNQIRNLFFRIYGYALQKVENDRNLSIKLSRFLISIDKGIYTAKKNIVVHSDILKMIENYIDDDDSVVFMTQTIYQKFETELKSCSVNNRYCLQAVLKENFSNKYYFFRDYISKSKNVTGIEQQLIDYINSSYEPVSKDELTRKFPGLTNIMLIQCLSNKSIINLFGSYISADNLLFTEDEKLYIDRVLRIVTNDLKQHNSREIYDYIENEKPYLLKSHFIYSQYALFSVLECFYNDNYNFERPYIANKNAEIYKPIDIIKEKFYGNHFIEIFDVLEFLKEIQHQIQSILDFLLQFNDEYLLYDKKRMVSINYLSLGSDLSVIASNLESLIETEVEDYLPIRDLTCFNRFPKLNVDWSEWLVYSIIYKYGKKFKVMTPNKVFKFAIPVIVKSEFEYDMVNIDENAYDVKESIDSNVNEIKLDDLDDIDNLIADFIEEEL